jgi:hypothetical protein
MVTIGLLLNLKGGRGRAFDRWLSAHSRALLRALPERTRMPRLLRDHAEEVLPFVAEPTFFTMAAPSGMELIHPPRQGRSPKPIGRKGISTGRSLVGIKLAWLINEAGEGVECVYPLGQSWYPSQPLPTPLGESEPRKRVLSTFPRATMALISHRGRVGHLPCWYMT